jgi:nitroreductase
MANAVDPIEFLRSLRSVRRFTDQPVPEEAIADMLTVARWTGSARNLQPWSFVVIKDREMLRTLAGCEGSCTHLATAALGILLVMDGGPLVAQETFDEGRLSERIALVATAHGLESCIGWFKGAGPGQVKDLLGIPPEKLVRTILSIGYEDVGADGARNHREHPRKPLAELVHEGRW